MSEFQESFSFNPGSLGINLDTMDEKVHSYISKSVDVAALRGRAEMYEKAPWRNRKWDARNGLWAEGFTDDDHRYQLYMGHSVEYGIYLEKMQNGRFQIVMPTLVATAAALMQSLIGMLEELDNPAPVLGAIEPSLTPQRGTSQGAAEHGEYVKGTTEKTVRKPKVFFKDAKGRFTAYKNASVGEGYISTTPKTRSTSRTKKTKRG